MQSQKQQNDLCFQGKTFSITEIQIYAPTSNAEEDEGERFYEDLQDFLKLTPLRRYLFHYRRLECKSRKSRNKVTGKFGLGVQNEAGQRLIEFCQENALIIANTFFQQHKGCLYTWTSPDAQY